MKNERGSLILVAMCFTAVIAIALASYITVCYRSAQFSAREFHSKQARYLAEVGLEEALWALNNGSWATSGKISDQTWTSMGADKTLNLDAANPSNDSSYDLGAGVVGALSLTIRNYSAPIPTVRSTATITLPDGTVFSKTFEATTQRASAFTNAVASAAGKVKFTSGGTVDSFNSAVAAYAAPSSVAGYAAVVAGKNVDFSGADVKGYLTTYGDANSLSYSPTTTVKGFFSPPTPNIDPGRIGASAFIPFFPVATPAPATWTGTLTDNLTATIGNVGAPTPAIWHSDGHYSLSTATLTVQGPVKIVIEGDLSITGAGSIVVDSTANASVEIFVGGRVTITSPSAFDNRPPPSAAAPVPANLALYATGLNKAVTWDSTARFDGVLYAANPGAGPVTIANTGPAAAFYGAILSSNNVTFTGAAPEIHYDYALRSTTFAGIPTPFVINVLSEVATER
jgi:hypothetical protein